MSRVIITKELATIGLSVMRGRDWNHGNQDGGEGNKGVISSIGKAGWVVVRWEHDNSSMTYRAGAEGRCDLYMYVPSAKSEKKTESSFKRVSLPDLTEDNLGIASTVRLKEACESRHPSITPGKAHKIARKGVNLIVLEGYPWEYNIYNFEVVTFEEPKLMAGSRFSLHEIVYVRNSSSGGAQQNGLVVNHPYIVNRLHDRQPAIKVEGGKDIWLWDSVMMNAEEWFEKQKTETQVTHPHKRDIGEIREKLLDAKMYDYYVEKGTNFKPNTNKTDGHTNSRNNTAIKVRRPSCIIKGPEKRTRTFF